jgi:hypothetical protein
MRDRASAAQEVAGSALKADYFDKEGHVIHYDVSTPTPTECCFSVRARAKAAIQTLMNSLEA